MNHSLENENHPKDLTDEEQFDETKVHRVEEY